MFISFFLPYINYISVPAAVGLRTEEAQVEEALSCNFISLWKGLGDPIICSNIGSDLMTVTSSLSLHHCVLWFQQLNLFKKKSDPLFTIEWVMMK